jgi:hypothetical protein
VQPKTHFQRQMYGGQRRDPLPVWPVWREEGDILVTPDGYRWRIERTPTVGDLVHVGDTVRTSYSSGGLVIRVKPYQICCCPYNGASLPVCEFYPLLPHLHTMAYHRQVTVWSITYVGRDGKQDRHGRFFDPADHSYINEMVAVGERILHLFEDNPDEVFVVAHPMPVGRPAQLTLF